MEVWCAATADCGCRPTNFGGTCCCEGLRHCGLANSSTASYTAAVFGSRGSPVGPLSRRGCFLLWNLRMPHVGGEDEWDGLAYEPGSVTCGSCPPPGGDHPSRSTVAGALKRPTRTLGRAALDRALSGLAPGGVYLAAPVARRAGGLLHHRFTLTSAAQGSPGGLFSVALACGFPRVGVTHHPALRSPDFPRQTCLRRPVRRDRPANPSRLQDTACSPAASNLLSFRRFPSMTTAVHPPFVRRCGPTVGCYGADSASAFRRKNRCR